MLEKYTSLNNIYQDGKCNNLRKTSLILVSLLPLVLLISRVVADIMLIIVGFSFVAYCINEKYFSFVKKPIFISLILLWLWFIVGSFFAFSNPMKSFGTSFVFVRYILFFFACTNWVLTDSRAVKFASKIIIIILIISASDALFQFFTGASISGRTWPGQRLTSFLRRPDIGIYLAKLVFPIVSFLLWDAFNDKSRRKILATLVSLVFILCIILLTGERTASVLSIASIGFILFVIGVANKRLIKYIMFSVSGILVFSSLLIYKSSFIYQRAISFLSDVGDFSNSLYGQLFKASILSWKEYGFFAGVGIRQFRESCLVFKANDQVGYCDLHSHNIYLEILSESGIVGFALLVIFVSLCLYQLSRSSVYLYSKNKDTFISSIFLFGGLITVLFPFSVTMSFITNWSGILNWISISFFISISQLQFASKGLKNH